MTDIERITDMEQCFDRVDGALRALEEAGLEKELRTVSKVGYRLDM